MFINIVCFLLQNAFNRQVNKVITQETNRNWIEAGMYGSPLVSIQVECQTSSSALTRRTM